LFTQAVIQQEELTTRNLVVPKARNYVLLQAIHKQIGQIDDLLAAVTKLNQEILKSDRTIL
jgi:hypothetical protein